MNEKDDVIVAVVSVSGSGKTSFIKTVTRDSNIELGGSLFSGTILISFTTQSKCTKDCDADCDADTASVKLYRGSIDSIGYNLIDTPGFKDSTMSNEEVAQKIQGGLESHCFKRAKLDALIYVHNITMPRMQGSADRNLRYVRQLLKQNPSVRLTLATSFWDHVQLDVGLEREAELLKSDSFWAAMVAKGRNIVRIQPDRLICSRALQSIVSNVVNERAGPPLSYTSPVVPTPRSPKRGFLGRLLSKPYKSNKDYGSSSSGQRFDVDYGSVTMPNSGIQEVEAQIKMEKEGYQRHIQRAMKESEEAYQREKAQLQAYQKDMLRQQQNAERLAQENYEHQMREERKRMLEDKQRIKDQLDRQRLAAERVRCEMEAERQRMVQAQQKLEDQQREHERILRREERDREDRERRYTSWEKNGHERQRLQQGGILVKSEERKRQRRQFIDEATRK
ncbi:hypothetical protein VTL71DRAFT_6833 [Oculimacula yallundae]|uniref:G domain-containing protein n=1 Tax=Oculimacula yallundae TaxID=86028 RepID=A0ABR4BWF5_9HELO